MASEKEEPKFLKELGITVIGAQSHYVLIPAKVCRLLRITKNSRVRFTLAMDKRIIIEKLLRA